MLLRLAYPSVTNTFALLRLLPMSERDRAFASLPERWQTVLWQTEIEGQSPAEVAPLLGLTANGASALAYRAREGLKRAYLRAHLTHTSTNRCRATVSELGAWTRRSLSMWATAHVEAHLDECAACRALASELADVNGALIGDEQGSDEPQSDEALIAPSSERHRNLSAQGAESAALAKMVAPLILDTAVTGQLATTRR